MHEFYNNMYIILLYNYLHNIFPNIFGGRLLKKNKHHLLGQDSIYARKIILAFKICLTSIDIMIKDEFDKQIHNLNTSCFTKMIGKSKNQKMCV